jgi:hypothetical protein
MKRCETSPVTKPPANLNDCKHEGHDLLIVGTCNGKLKKQVCDQSVSVLNLQPAKSIRVNVAPVLKRLGIPAVYQWTISFITASNTQTTHSIFTFFHHCT